MPKSSHSSDQLFLLDNKEDLQEHLIRIIEAGKCDIAIFSRCLTPRLFSQQAIRDSISKLARRSALSNVRIVIEHPQTIVESRHLLLSLSHRLNSKIKIQKLLTEPQEKYEFVIVDNDKLWLQHQEENNSGFANYDARPEVKRFLNLFDNYWKNSEEDTRLRKLCI